MQDVDTGVGQDAQDALCKTAQNSDRLCVLLRDAGCKAAFGALLTSEDTVVRARAQSLLVDMAAASAGAAEAVVNSGASRQAQPRCRRHMYTAWDVPVICHD